MNTENIKCILIVKLGAIGDVVHALPLLPILRRKFPDSFIAWVVEKKAGEILAGNRYLDEIIEIDTKKWRKGLCTITDFKGSSKEILSVFKKIKKRGFDLAIDVQGLIKSGVIGFLSGAKFRIGFNKKDCREKWNTLFTTYKSKAQTENMHIVDKNLQPLELLGIDLSKEKKEFFIAIPEKEKEKASAFFKEKGCIGDRPLIGLNPGGGWVTKLWGTVKYAELGDRLYDDFKSTILFLWGTEKERDLVTAISGKMKNKPLIAYKSTLKEFCALVNHCSLVIGPDTGPLHIADSLGIQTITLFGPSSPELNRPYNKGHIHVVGKCNDLGCYKRKCNDFICMGAITVDDVVKVVNRELQCPS